MEKVYEVADVINGILSAYRLTHGEAVAVVAIVQAELIVSCSLIEARAANAEETHD